MVGLWGAGEARNAGLLRFARNDGEAGKERLLMDEVFCFFLSTKRRLFLSTFYCLSFAQGNGTVHAGGEVGVVGGDEGGGAVGSDGGEELVEDDG